MFDSVGRPLDFDAARFASVEVPSASTVSPASSSARIADGSEVTYVDNLESAHSLNAVPASLSAHEGDGEAAPVANEENDHEEHDHDGTEQHEDFAPAPEAATETEEMTPPTSPELEVQESSEAPSSQLEPRLAQQLANSTTSNDTSSSSTTGNQTAPAAPNTTVSTAANTTVSASGNATSISTTSAGNSTAPTRRHHRKHKRHGKHKRHRKHKRHPPKWRKQWWNKFAKEKRNWYKYITARKHALCKASPECRSRSALAAFRAAAHAEKAASHANSAIVTTRAFMAVTRAHDAATTATQAAAKAEVAAAMSQSELDKQQSVDVWKMSLDKLRKMQRRKRFLAMQEHKEKGWYVKEQAYKQKRQGQLIGVFNAFVKEMAMKQSKDQDHKKVALTAALARLSKRIGMLQKKLRFKWTTWRLQFRERKDGQTKLERSRQTFLQGLRFRAQKAMTKLKWYVRQSLQAQQRSREEEETQIFTRQKVAEAGAKKLDRRNELSEKADARQEQRDKTLETRWRVNSRVRTLRRWLDRVNKRIKRTQTESQQLQKAIADDLAKSVRFLDAREKMRVRGEKLKLKRRNKTRQDRLKQRVYKENLKLTNSKRRFERKLTLKLQRFELKVKKFAQRQKAQLTKFKDSEAKKQKRENKNKNGLSEAAKDVAKKAFETEATAAHAAFVAKQKAALDKFKARIENRKKQMEASKGKFKIKFAKRQENLLAKQKARENRLAEQAKHEVARIDQDTSGYYQRKSRLVKAARQRSKQLSQSIRRVTAGLRMMTVRLKTELKTAERSFNAALNILKNHADRRERNTQERVMRLRKAESSNEQLMKREEKMKRLYTSEVERKDEMVRAELKRVEAQNKLAVTNKEHRKEQAQKAKEKKAEAVAAQALATQKKEAELKEKQEHEAEEVQKKGADEVRRKADQDKRLAQELEEATGGKPLMLLNRLEPFGHSYRSPIWTVIGPYCVLSGVASGPNIRSQLAQLDHRCTPRDRLIFDQHVDHALTTRVDAFPDGVVQWHAGSGNIESGWIPFDGIMFALNTTEPKPLDPVLPWINFGKPYRDLSYVVHEDYCLLSGLIRINSWDVHNWGSVLTVLPNECRPREGRIVFRVNNQDVSHRVDVFPDGKVVWVTGPRRHGWISLDGIGFFRESSIHPLNLLNGWDAYLQSYRVPAVKRQGQLCVLTGQMKSSRPRRYIAQLPHFCKPNARTIHFVNQHDRTIRIDVDQKGRVMWVDGVNKYGWLSLDGIRFPVGGDSKFVLRGPLRQLRRDKMPMLQGFTPYRGGYEYPTFTKMGHFCILNGLAQAKNMKNPAALLPEECRPDHRLVFDNHVYAEGTARTDVFPNGKVAWVAGPQRLSHGWFAFGGMMFPTKEQWGNSILLQNHWVPFGKPYAPPQYYQAGSFCLLSGLVRLRDNNGNLFKPLIGTLPPGCRPKDGRIVFNANHHEVTLRIDITTNGEIQYVAGPRKYAWISLEGLGFMVESSSQPIELAKSWVPYKGAYRVPSFKRNANLCVLSGVATGGPDAIIGVVPEECRPYNRLIFFTNHNQYTHRIDVLPDGRIKRSGGFRKWAFESLDGIKYAVPPLGFSKWVPFGKLPKQGPSALMNNARPYGRGYADPMFTIFGDYCILDGTVEVLDMRAAVAQLPRNCRPDRRRIFNVGVTGANSARVDVYADGIIRWRGGNSDGSWLPLDGIMFATKKAVANKLTLAPRWEDFGAAYTKAGYNKDGDLCVVTGLIRTFDRNVASWNSHLATLPEECRPHDGILIFHLNSHEYAHRVDVHPNGQIHWVAGTRSQPWISLDGISFFTESSSQPLPMLNGYTAYSKGDTGFRRPSIKKQDVVCVLSGVVNGNGRRHITTTLPECRPKARMIFTVNHHTHGLRIDVLPDGTVEWVAGKRHQTWISLDGIRYAAEGPAGIVGQAVVPKLTGSAITLDDAYKVYGKGYAAPQYNVIGSICVLAGMLSGHNTRGTFAQLPETCRPPYRHIFDNHVTDGNTMRVDVLPQGQILYAGGAMDSNFMSFSGMIFPVVTGKDQERINLGPGWTDYGSGFAPPTVTQQDELCVLSGLIRRSDWNVNSWNPLLGTLPADCVPRDGNLIFHVNHDYFTHRVDINTDGTIMWIAGTKQNAWIALDGIAYYPTSREALQLEAGFQEFGAKFRPPSYRKQGNLCVVSGMVKGIGGPRHVATLPESCRPAGKLAFGVGHHDTALRFVVGPDGRIRWKEGANLYGWASLDSILFVADSEPFGKVRTDPIPWQAGELRLWNGLRAYGGEYESPQYARYGHVCLVDGSFASEKNNVFDLRTTFTRLPRDCRPEKRMILDRHTDDGRTVRVDILNDGLVRWAGGADRGWFLGFDGMVFPTFGGDTVNMKLNIPWTNYERGYADAGYLVQDSVCYLTGVIRIDDWNPSRWNQFIGQLPAECRPTARTIHNANYDSTTDRLDIDAEGRILWVAGAQRQLPWLSLDGIAFARVDGEPVTLNTDWEPYGGEYRRPSFFKQGSICFLSGLARRKAPTRLIGTLPDRCRPKARLIFQVNHHDYNARFDITRDGQILWVSGNMVYDWFSLDGIRFVAGENQVVAVQGTF